MPDINTGMKVVGLDGVDVGRVKVVESGYFVLDRPKAPDVAVPFAACMRVEGDMVWLRVEGAEVYRQGWQPPPPPAGAG